MRISDWCSDVCSSDLGLKRYCSSPIHKRFDILDGGDYQKDVKSNREVHTTLTSGQNLLKARNIPTGKEQQKAFKEGKTYERTEERREVKEGVSTCRSGGSPTH